MKHLLRLASVLFLIHTPFASAQTYGIVGDAGHANSKRGAVIQSLLQFNVTQLVMPGDNIYDTRLTYSDVWDPWLKAGLSFPIVAIGNHTKGHAEEVAYFGMPGEFYSKSDGTARFIVLNSNNVSTAQQQARWLNEELTQATEPFVFLVYHHSPMSLTFHHSWKERERFHRETRPVILRHRERITALLLGHDHIASVAEMEGIPLIVSGASFELHPASPVNFTDEGISLKTRWLSKNGRSWARLETNASSSEAWVQFVGVGAKDAGCSIRISPRPLLLGTHCQ